MKTLLLFTFPFWLICCNSTTTTAPDGTVTVTKTIDQGAVNAGRDVVRDVVIDRRSGK